MGRNWYCVCWCRYCNHSNCSSPVTGWIGAPNAYINSGIVTTISGTDATYTNVNANNIYSPYMLGQTGGDPVGAGVLYVQMQKLVLNFG